MAIIPADMEIDRLLNLIRGFGWSMDEKEVTEKDIILTIHKEIKKE